MSGLASFWLAPSASPIKPESAAAPRELRDPAARRQPGDNLAFKAADSVHSHETQHLEQSQPGTRLDALPKTLPMRLGGLGETAPQLGHRSRQLQVPALLLLLRPRLHDAPLEASEPFAVPSLGNQFLQ